jgi:hypothetical protein
VEPLAAALVNPLIGRGPEPERPALPSLARFIIEFLDLGGLEPSPRDQIRHDSAEDHRRFQDGIPLLADDVVGQSIQRRNAAKRQPADISKVVYMPSRGLNRKNRVTGGIPTNFITSLIARKNTAAGHHGARASTSEPALERDRLRLTSTSNVNRSLK